MKNEITEKAKNILKRHNIQPSVQRIKILEFLLKNRTHPSADEIYKHISAELPTLSKTTVYNTIEALVKKGVIKLVMIDSKELRVDAFIEPHAHFHCIECGRIYDIEVEIPDFTSKKVGDGHLVKTQDLYLEGVCRRCLMEKEEKN
uniref:Transcriptional repressor n=1 Tax=candidate division WOR-3 bacterium TaxID=2052148 RepID=A0A7V3ZZI7_UNCW3